MKNGNRNVKNKSDKKIRNKDPLSVKIKIRKRNTTRGVENIAILHSTPVDLEQPK